MVCWKKKIAKRFPNKIKGFIYVWDFKYDDIWYSTYLEVRKYFRSDKTFMQSNEFSNYLEKAFITDCIRICSEVLDPVNLDGIDEENLFVTIVLSFLQIFINYCGHTIIYSGRYIENIIEDIVNKDSTKNVKNLPLFIEILESSDIRFTRSRDKQVNTNSLLYEGASIGVYLDKDNISNENMINDSYDLASNIIGVIKEYLSKQLNIAEYDLSKDPSKDEMEKYHEIFEDQRNSTRRKAINNTTEEENKALFFMYNAYFNAIEGYIFDFIELLAAEILCKKNIIINYETNLYKNMCKNCSNLLKRVIFFTCGSLHYNLKRNLNCGHIFYIKSLYNEYYKFLYAMKFGVNKFDDKTLLYLCEKSAFLSENFNSINDKLNSLVADV